MKLLKTITLLVVLFASCKDDSITQSLNENSYFDSKYKVADSLLILNQHQEALDSTHKALAEANAHHNNYGILKGNYCLSNIYYYLPHSDSCAIYGEKVLEIAEETKLDSLNYKIIVETHSLLSNLYTRTGNYTIAFKHIFKASQLLSGINDADFKFAQNGRLAASLAGLNQYSEAQKLFTDNLRLVLQLNKDAYDKTYALQGVYRDIGLMNFHLKQYQLALTYYDSASWVMDTCKHVNPLKSKDFEIANGVIHGNRGQTFYMLKDLDNAEHELKINIQVNARKGYDTNDALTSLIALGIVYLDLNEIDRFNDIMLRTDSLYETIHSSTYFNRLVKMHALAYERHVDSEENYLQFKRFSDWNDSATSSALQHSIRNKFVFNDLDRNNKEIEQLYLETLSNRLMFQKALAAGLIILVLCLILINYIVKYRKNDKKLRKLYEQLARNQVALENSYLEMQKVLREKDNILSIVAHDLKSPLASISALANMLESELRKNSSLYGETEKYIKYIISSAEHMNSVTDDLIELSMNENSLSPLEKSKVKMRPFLESIIQLFELKAADKRLVIKLICDDSVEFEINQQKFTRAVVNLLSNAVKFSNMNQEIVLKVMDENNIKRLVIKDAGVGISKENIELIFDRFTKAKNVGTAGERTVGLGLSIVKQIVDLHNGKITVISELGKGTEFTIIL